MQWKVGDFKLSGYLVCCRVKLSEILRPAPRVNFCAFYGSHLSEHTVIISLYDPNVLGLYK
jgi:hypothetical protein